MIENPNEKTRCCNCDNSLETTIKGDHIRSYVCCNLGIPVKQDFFCKHFEERKDEK